MVKIVVCDAGTSAIHHTTKFSPLQHNPGAPDWSSGTFSKRNVQGSNTGIQEERLHCFHAHQEGSDVPRVQGKPGPSYPVIV